MGYRGRMLARRKLAMPITLQISETLNGSRAPHNMLTSKYKRAILTCPPPLWISILLSTMQQPTNQTLEWIHGGNMMRSWLVWSWQPYCASMDSATGLSGSMRSFKSIWFCEPRTSPICWTWWHLTLSIQRRPCCMHSALVLYYWKNRVPGTASVSHLRGADDFASAFTHRSPRLFYLSD